MTQELHKLANDPNFVVQFAIGDPCPELVPQPRDSGIRFCGIYYDKPKQFVLKSAHMSREDVRIFDVESGRMVMVSHYPGKNPYEMLDPLGLTNQDTRYAVAGGEWESLYEVSAMGPFQSFKIRPKWMSRHGRQYIKQGDNTIMNVGKMGKLKTMSLRDHFMIGKGDDTNLVYKCIADMMGRSVGIYNAEDQLVAQIAKTSKALLLTAAFGHGSESKIEIAPGVDCSTILAIVYGMQQVGQHFMTDAFDNYVADPLKDQVIDGAVDAAGLGAAVDTYTNASNDAFNAVGSLTRTARFMYDNFF